MNKKKIIMKRLLIILVFFIIRCDSGLSERNNTPQMNVETLSIGDKFPGFKEFNVCDNENVGYDYNDTSKVILLSLFTSWWSVCQAHVSSLETLHQNYNNQGLIVIAAGKDMGNPYTCEEWTTTFGASYLIINDSSLAIEQQFSLDGIVPYYVIIDKTRIIRYSSSGFEQSELESLIQTVLDE